MRAAVLALCAAEVLTMAGVFAFPALLPSFMAEWALTNTEAGWISGITFAGYAVAVPVLTAATDRIDARRIYMLGAVIAALSVLGFSLFAHGFWTAMLFRALAGVGLAGTYMPGLKALVDRTGGPEQPKWMSWYTAAFSLGTSASFLFAGAAAAWWGWRVAFAVAGVAAGLAAVLVMALVRPKPPLQSPQPAPLLDFRPVLRNRPVLGFVLGYAAHMWELFGLRSWLVAFLAFAATAARQTDPWLAPTQAATLAALVAMATSIWGAGIAVRFDRRAACSVFAVLSATMAAGIGFTAGWPYGIVVTLMLVYNGVVQLDSAALTTGAVLEAEPHRRGATIAVHSLLGFLAAFLGPLAFGLVLDLAGGQASRLAWGLAFASVGAVAMLGPLALRWSRP
jgi:MFS family permease